MFLEPLQPFAVALLIGLGVGIERERKTREGFGTLGVRTFAVVALSGAVAAKVGSEALTIGLLLMLAALLAVGYRRAAALTSSESVDVGLTTEVAAGFVFALGYLALREQLLAGVLGVVVVTMLYSRRVLHEFSREFLRPADIVAALILAILAFIVMPILPDRAIDPWELLNPRRMTQIMLLIASIEFGGYMVERLGGPRIGALAKGFFGGLASSTAVFLTVAKLARSDQAKIWTAISAGLAAAVAALSLFVAIVATTAPSIMVPAGVPVLTAAFVAAAGAYVVMKKCETAALVSTGAGSPLDVRGVLKLSAFVFGLMGLTVVARAQLGADAVGALSFVSGLFELHATALAGATLNQVGKLTAEEATRTLLLAALASIASKMFISWVVGFGRFAIYMTVALMLVAASGLGAHFLLAAFWTA